MFTSKTSNHQNFQNNRFMYRIVILHNLCLSGLWNDIRRSAYVVSLEIHCCNVCVIFWGFVQILIILLPTLRLFQGFSVCGVAYLPFGWSLSVVPDLKSILFLSSFLWFSPVLEVIAGLFCSERLIPLLFEALPYRSFILKLP